MCLSFFVRPGTAWTGDFWSQSISLKFIKKKKSFLWKVERKKNGSEYAGYQRQNCLSCQTSLLCITVESAGEGPMALAVAVDVGDS